MNAQEIDKQIDRLDERITRESSDTQGRVWAKFLDAKVNFARELGGVETRVMEDIGKCRTELTGRIDTLEARMDARFDKIEADSNQLRSMFDQTLVIVRKLEAKLL